MDIRKAECDVAVIGGGPGGIPAALSAARHGARVILCERNGHLGGNAVMGLPWLGFLSQGGRRIIGGIAQEFIDSLMLTGDSFGHVRCPMHNSVTLVHPDAFRLLALRVCLDAGVKILFHTELTDARVENGKIKSVTVTGKGTAVEISAKVFIDATGDGDLGYVAGAGFEKGSEESGMLQPPTVMFAVTGFEKEAFMRFLEEHPENMKQLDSVCIDAGYDTSLWRSTDSYVFVGMKAYLDEIRRKTDCPVLRENIIFINSTIPGKIFINTVRVPDCDGSDIESLTRGEIEGQLQIEGIINMLKRYVPGFENIRLDSISPAIGIRESRRFRGLERITSAQALAGYKPDNTIALAGYKIDIHNGRGEGTILKKIEEPYGIPMGAVISADIDNLLFSGRCISMDHETLGSMRIMPTCMAVGQGAGTLAACAVRDGVGVSEIRSRDVTELLLKDGAILR